MAERDTKEKGAHLDGDGAETQSEWQRALVYTKENPTKVAGGAGFLLLCIAIGGVFSVKNSADALKENTEYAVAATTEEPGLKAEALAEIADENSRWSVEALYVSGETAIEAKSYDKAREAFEAVLANHSDSEFAPKAADGLAFLNENAGKFEEALAGYTKVFETWSDSLTGRRQPFNMARVEEALDKFPEAIAHYQQQIEIFPESSVSRKSQAALDRLKMAKPDLFPETPAEEDAAEVAVEAAPMEEAATAADAAPVEATPAPAVEAAPAEEAPATAADAASETPSN